MIKIKRECGVSKKKRIIQYLMYHNYESDILISEELNMDINDVERIMDEIFGD